MTSGSAFAWPLSSSLAGDGSPLAVRRMAGAATALFGVFRAERLLWDGRRRHARHGQPNASAAAWRAFGPSTCAPDSTPFSVEP